MLLQFITSVSEWNSLLEEWEPGKSAKWRSGVENVRSCLLLRREALSLVAPAGYCLLSSLAEESFHTRSASALLSAYMVTLIWYHERTLVNLWLLNIRSLVPLLLA